MIARDLIHTAESLGIFFWVDGDKLRYKSLYPVTEDFKDKLRDNKSGIVQLLTSTHDNLNQFESVIETSIPEEEAPSSLVPIWCSRNCLNLELIGVPLDGPIWGCVQKHPDFEEWKRLDWMKQCPRVIQNRILKFQQKPRANCL